MYTQAQSQLTTLRAFHPQAFHATLLTLTLLPLYIGSYRFRLHHPYGGPTTHHPIQLESHTFIAQWQNTHVTQPFNPYPLAAYCNGSTWQPNLVFDLVATESSVTGARQNILDFVFHAIEAGASIMLPSLGPRVQKGGQSQDAVQPTSFSTWFDEVWFIESLQQACPQMIVHKPVPGQKLAETLPNVYQPRSRRLDEDVDKTRKISQLRLQEWLQTEIGASAIAELKVVNVASTTWNVDTRSLPEGFRRNFGQVVRAGPEARRLAATAVQALATKYSAFLEIDPRHAVPRHGFYGAQFNASGEDFDAVEGNSDFSTQADALVEQAHKQNLQVIYLTTTNEAALTIFRSKAAAHHPPLLVTSKLDLLAPADSETLKQMTPAEQEALDYSVLLRSSAFGGSVNSDLAFSVAMTRNQWLEDRGRVLDPWYITHVDPNVAFDDGLSRLLDRDAKREAVGTRGTWP